MTKNLLQTHHGRGTELVNLDELLKDFYQIVIEYIFIREILENETKGVDGV